MTQYYLRNFNKTICNFFYIKKKYYPFPIVHFKPKGKLIRELYNFKNIEFVYSYSQ